MKAWILIVLCFILGFTLYIFIWNNDSAIVVNKQYKYFGCKVKFKHAYLFTDEYRYYENYYRQDSARYSLMNCLCNKYITTKDSSIKNFILSFYNNDSYSRQNYISKIAHNKINTDLLLKNYKKIFEDDSKVLKIILNNKDRDSAEFKEVLFHFMDKSYNARDRYYQIIEALPENAPSIDTIIRYREIIFKSPFRYY